MPRLNPSSGGCWFCQTDDEKEKLIFSYEVDAYFHESCLKEELKKNKNNLEAKAIKEELDYERKGKGV